MKRLCWLSFFLVSFALGQDAPAPIDPAVKAEVKQLLAAMHASDLMRRQMQSLMPAIAQLMRQNSALSPAFVQEFLQRGSSDLLSSEEFNDILIRAYAARFTLAEIKDLEAFYNTPTGRKLIQTQPELLADINRQSMEYGQKVAMKLAQQILQEHPEYIQQKGDSTSAKPASPK